MTALVMLVLAAVFYVLLARVSSIFHLSRVSSFLEERHSLMEPGMSLGCRGNSLCVAEPEELTLGAHDRKVRSAGATPISAGVSGKRPGATARVYIISHLIFNILYMISQVPNYHRFLNHSRHYSWKEMSQLSWCKNQLLVTYRHVDSRLAKVQNSRLETASRNGRHGQAPRQRSNHGTTTGPRAIQWNSTESIGPSLMN